MHELPGVCLVTLQQAWDDYKDDRKLKPSTIRVYQSCLASCVSDWLHLPIGTITKQMIKERHSRISCTENRWGSGEAMANLCMRVLRALFTYAGHKYDLDALIIKNPVIWLSKVRAWNHVPKRENLITEDQMERWFEGVFALGNTTVRDYLILLQLTGLRRNEGSRILWDDVNLQINQITVRDTKNSKATKSARHIIPISWQLSELLANRKRSQRNEYVFPGGARNSHLSLWNQTHLQVVEFTGIEFSPHDLRRTFTTTADALDIDIRHIKALVNHKTSDVTESYIIRSPEKLRPAMQAINDEILRQAKLTDLRGLWEN